MTVKMDFIGEEVIKPSSPTPNHLKSIHLSLFDQFLPPTYQTVILFYDKEPGLDQTNPPVEENIRISLIKRLKNSLSHTLTRFYPLAGRIQGVTVDCNDEGVLFTEARADVLLLDILSNPRSDLLQQLIVTSHVSDPGTWPLLRVKVSFFKNKGFAVAVGVSHKICTTSLGMFVCDWTNTAKGHVLAVNPDFESLNFYPPGDISINLPPTLERTNTLTKRFVFGPAKIKELKSRASSKHVPHATRNEATTALLFKCMKKVAPSKADVVITQTMDLRARVPTFLSGKSIGNFFFLPVLKENTEKKIEIQEMVFKLRNTKKELDELIKEDSDHQVGERLMSEMLSSLYEMSPETQTYVVTSWCRMPFYGADFGFGTPVWIAADSIDKTQVVLVDSNDGEGIEAWVTLPKDDMLAFEHDEDLLAFAST